MTGHFGLCLSKPRTGKSRGYRDVIVFEKLGFQNVLKKKKKRKADVFKFHWFDGRFFKRRFRDGLVWAVDLTVEIKLRFQISPAHSGRGLIHVVHVV